MTSTIFSPGSTIGILGGGQLARMLCMEAKRMGYRTLVWTGGLEAPAMALCDAVIELPFDAPDAIAQFTAAADVATAEFENIPRATLDAVAAGVTLRPSASAIATCANREQEKTFLREQNIPCAPFWIVTSADELAQAMHALQGPGVLKTSAFGYDGKGQKKLTGSEDPAQVWQEFQAPRAILEGFISFQSELSVMIARNASGEVRCFDPVETTTAITFSISPSPPPLSLRRSAWKPSPSPRASSMLSTTWGSWAWNFSCNRTAPSSSTKWHRARTTPAITPSMPARPRSSSNNCAPSAAWPSAPHDCSARR
jgi:5-(carboxyamino)imidazole ribonucleotide synthase